MIIESIKLTNFGLYKGDNQIILAPELLESKNITLVSGQNGVGKSTLLEAIHLCLLGSLSIDSRFSETNYEKYLFKRSYNGNFEKVAETAIELVIEFVKSGSPIRYKICRRWKNDPKGVDESISIEENGKALNDLSKKERNLFLRELIQPGLAKVMFFDGEKLLSLYDENNLTSFIAESCRYLFGLNFVDLLNTDLSYYINKLYSQQDATQALGEIKKIKEELALIDAEIIKLEDNKSQLTETILELKGSALQAERQISDQGRWAATTLEGLKKDRAQTESLIAVLKKELVELYSKLGPFAFSQKLLISLRDRLITEKDINKWQHAADLISEKVSKLEEALASSTSMKELSLDEQSLRNILPELKNYLLAKPKLFEDGEVVYHEMSDNERTTLIRWIDEVISTVAALLKSKSQLLAESEESLKLINKEQSSFSKDDILLPLLKDIQEINKGIGAYEQKLATFTRQSDEASKRKEFYSNRLASLEQRMQLDTNVDERLKLSTRTKLVLEAYGKQLLARKLGLLRDKVLAKFNLLCRKDDYLDNLDIDPGTFAISLSRKQIQVEHAHLSAGEKQLLIISFLWGLRELTNIALPLIIDTPLARLDLEHRKAFVEEFLPAIQPQVILIGTDMELAGDVVGSLEPHIARHYKLGYNALEQATEWVEMERNYKVITHDEI